MMSSDEVKEGRRGVFWVHDEVFDVWAKDLGVYGVVVYAYLCRRANAKSECHPSLNGTAKLLGISKSKLCTTLDTLEAKQFIRRTQKREKARGNTATVYTVLEPPYFVRTEDKGSVRDGQGLVRKADMKKESTGGRNTKTNQKVLSESKAARTKPLHNHPPDPPQPRLGTIEEAREERERGRRAQEKAVFGKEMT